MLRPVIPGTVIGGKPLLPAGQLCSKLHLQTEMLVNCCILSNLFTYYLLYIIKFLMRKNWFKVQHETRSPVHHFKFGDLRSSYHGDISKQITTFASDVSAHFHLFWGLIVQHVYKEEPLLSCLGQLITWVSDSRSIGCNWTVLGSSLSEPNALPPWRLRGLLATAAGRP